jgi:hypothetical protein
MSVITEVHYLWGSDKLHFNITFKFIPLKLCLFSVLLHMDMNSYILHTQKHTLLHLWTLDVTDGSTTHQDAWMLPSFMHLLYCTTYSKFLNPPQWRNSPSWARAPLTMASWSHSDWPHSCRTTLSEWSAKRKDPHGTTHNTDKTQTSMPRVGFELRAPASEQRQTHALRCAATRIDQNF